MYYFWNFRTTMLSLKSLSHALGQNSRTIYLKFKCCARKFVFIYFILFVISSSSFEQIYMKWMMQPSTMKHIRPSLYQNLSTSNKWPYTMISSYLVFNTYNGQGKVCLIDLFLQVIFYYFHFVCYMNLILHVLLEI